MAFAKARESGLQQLYDALTCGLTDAERNELDSLLSTGETSVRPGNLAVASTTSRSMPMKTVRLARHSIA